jgi:Tfp pilus assembly protein PilF
LLTGCGGAAVRYEYHITRGNQYLAAGNLAKAGIEFANALQIQPKSAQAMYLSATVAQQRGDVRTAAALYRGALGVKPDYDEARAALGSIYALAGAPQRALELIGDALAKRPDTAELMVVRANANLLLGKVDLAHADAERAVQLAPANEHAVALLAAIYARAGDTARAIALVRSTLPRQPKSLDLYRILADLYVRAGQPAEAEEVCQQLVELQPKELLPRLQLALLYSQHHDLQRAQQTLESAINALPQNTEAKLAMAEFIASQRSPEQALQGLSKLVDAQPGDLDLRLAFARFLEQWGTPAQATAVYRVVLQKDGTGPRGLQARNRMASMELSEGRFDEAQPLIAEVLAHSPRDPDALVERADLALAHNDPAAAIADLRAVLRDLPNSARLRHALARAYQASGEFGLAEEAFRNALDVAPLDAALRVDYARFLALANRPEESRGFLEETVRKLPQEISAREALVRAYLAKPDLAAAQVAAEDLQRLRPRAASGYYYAGLIDERSNHPDEAALAFEHALQLEPKSFDTLAALVRLDMKRTGVPTAIARASSALKADPDNAQITNLMGELELANTQPTVAAQDFTRAIALAPAWWMPHRNLAATKNMQGDATGAALEYAKALQLAPAQPQLVGEFAEFYVSKGRIDDAISLYDAVYRRNPRTEVVAANNLAMLLATYKKDRASLDRARELTVPFASADDAALLDTVGWVHAARGEYQEALPVLERAVQRMPASATIRYHAAVVELRTGQSARARANLESALSSSGSFEGVNEARVMLAQLKRNAG